MKFLLLFALFSLSCFSKDIEVLKLKLNPSGSEVVYKSAFDQAKCEFVPGVAPSFYRTMETPLGSWQQEQNFLDRLYFGVKEQQVAPKKLTLILNAADNIKIIVIPESIGGDCVIKRQMSSDKGVMEIGSIEIVLNNRFGIPILDEIIVENQDTIQYEKSKLRPWDLSGYFPIYEAHLGFGFNLHSNIYKKNDKRFWRNDPAFEPVPMILVRVGPFFINKDGAGVLLLPFPKATLISTFLFEGEPFRLDGFRERKRSAFSGFIFKSGDFYVQYFKDIGKVSRGWVANFAWNPEYNITNRYQISPRIMAQYWDGDYTNYYFGVQGFEPQHLGSTFKAKETWNGMFTLSQSYRWGRIKGVLVTELKVYGSQVELSPLTKQRSEFRLISGFLYNLF